MKSSTVSYKQSLQNKGGVKLYTNEYFFVVVAPNLQVIVIIKKGDNVNHASFDDVKKNLLDNDCHYQKWEKISS